MRRRFMVLVCGFMLLTLLLPFQAAAAESGSETLLYQFDGTILDFDESNIVWKETGNKVLWLYNRADKSQVKLYDAAGSDYTIIHAAKLSAEGVVFNLSITDPSGWPTYHSSYYWNDGNARKLADGDVYEVKGNFAVFTDRVLDLSTGQSRTLPNSGFKNSNRFDLAADGTVVYTDPTLESNLYKSLPDGTLTTYVPPSSYRTYSGALIDGNNILYKVIIRYTDKWSLRVRDANDKITELASNPYQKGSEWYPDPRTLYQINNGWITYKEYNKEKDHWILYVRSPEGATKQVFESLDWWSWQAAPLSINQLGRDGTVAYTFNDKTYISTPEGKLLYSSKSPGEIEYREHIIIGLGGNEYRYSAWYRVAGGSLYSIRL